MHIENLWLLGLLRRASLSSSRGKVGPAPQGLPSPAGEIHFSHEEGCQSNERGTGPNLEESDGGEACSVLGVNCLPPCRFCCLCCFSSVCHQAGGAPGFIHSSATAVQMRTRRPGVLRVNPGICLFLIDFIFLDQFRFTEKLRR